MKFIIAVETEINEDFDEIGVLKMKLLSEHLGARILEVLPEATLTIDISCVTGELNLKDFTRENQVDEDETPTPFNE